MPEVVHITCPHCAATLPPAGGKSRIRCEYCGYEFDLKHTVVQPAAAPPPARAPQPRQMPHFPSAPPPARRGCAISVILPLVILLAVGGTVVTRFVGTGISVPWSGPGVLGMGPKLTHHQTVGLFAVNGDGIEDPLFIAREVLAGDQMFVVAFDGATMSEVWRSEALGNYSQGYQFTHAAVVGNRVAITDFRGRALLLDLSTGTPAATAQLPDRAKKLCGSAAGGTILWAEADNGQNATIDTATGFVQASPASPFGETCEAPRDLSLPPARTAPVAMQMPGFEPSEVLTDGTVTVAIGRRGAGVRVPMAVGLPPQTGAPLWQVVPLSVDEALYVEDSPHPTVFRLGGARLYVAYSLQNDQGRLVALDARSGARLWESAVPSCCAHGVDVDEIRLGPTRLVTEQFGQAEVWDAATGRLVGRVTVW